MNVDELYQKAQILLHEGRNKEAREVGHQLLKLRFSGAFEILARSFHQEGALPVAIQVLESGTREAPSVWLLWMQLGNYYSEAGRYGEAVEAYQAAKGCPAADTEQILFNEALLRLKLSSREKGLTLLSELIRSTESKEMRLAALTHRLSALVESEHLTEALIELGEAFLHDSDNAEILTKLSLQLLSQGDEKNAVNLARQALGLKRAGQAASVLRQVEGETSERCFLYRVVLRGRLEEEDGPIYHFHKTAKVYARNEAEASAFAVDFEPEDVRAELEVRELVKLDGPTEDRLGVDWSSGLMFFDPEEEPSCS